MGLTSQRQELEDLRSRVKFRNAHTDLGQQLGSRWCSVLAEKWRPLDRTSGNPSSAWVCNSEVALAQSPPGPHPTFHERLHLGLQLLQRIIAPCLLCIPSLMQVPFHCQTPSKSKMDKRILKSLPAIPVMRNISEGVAAMQDSQDTLDH